MRGAAGAPGPSSLFCRLVTDPCGSVPRLLVFPHDCQEGAKNQEISQKHRRQRKTHTHSLTMRGAAGAPGPSSLSWGSKDSSRTLAGPFLASWYFHTIVKKARRIRKFRRSIAVGEKHTLTHNIEAVGTAGPLEFPTFLAWGFSKNQ
jgi:hypothetical protein